MHMYKVVVVDDEPIIVEGMTRTIDWEKWNCEVVSAAYSGQEGKDAVRKYSRISCLLTFPCLG